jgi:asparagine synthase (glutamine-hydrolysing)
VASEIKAFGDLAFTSSDVFDLFEFCFDEHTLYRDVYALQPGHYLIYRPDQQTLRIRRWWDIAEQIDGHLDDEDEAIERFVETLRDAVRLRLRADVPVTMFMSGGVDSSLIAALAGVDRVYTCQFVEFEGMIDEAPYAQDLADRLGMELELVVPTKAEFFDALSSLARHLEMPTGSFSVFPLYQLARAVKRDGYKVVLSGEGADELFGGYARNEFLVAEQSGPQSAKQRQYASMLGRFRGDELDQFCRMASRSGLEGAARMRMFLRPHWRERQTMLQNMCFVEARFFLQPLLQMGDRMTMAHGIEARCPFLDYRMVELAFSLSDRIRHRDGRGKWIVREAARRVLPGGAKLLEREIKHGLPTPVNLWMQGRQSFDRKYWNAILTAECMKALVGS